MNIDDPQLVQQITDEVVRALSRRLVCNVDEPGCADSEPSPGESANPSAKPQRAEVRPPIGICTGDYSQFPELIGRLYGKRRPPTPGNAAASMNRDPGGAGELGSADPTRSLTVAARSHHDPAEPSAPPLSGLVSEATLKQALKDTPETSVVRLDPKAILTPLARDLIKAHPDRIVHGQAAPAPGKPGVANPTDQADAPWLWWIDGSCPFVSQWTAQHRSALLPATAPKSPGGLAEFASRLAEAIRGGEAVGGLVFVRSAARATCLLNGLEGVRAIVATCDEAVQQGIDEVGANALIVEYPYQKPERMQPMLDRMIAATPKPPAEFERTLRSVRG